MKIPRYDIYWQCICPFLECANFALFEASVDSKPDRAMLLLPAVTPDISDNTYPYSTNQNLNPYQTILHMSTGSIVALVSKDMLLWCERRCLRLPRIELQYDTGMGLNHDAGLLYPYLGSPHSSNPTSTNRKYSSGSTKTFPSPTSSPRRHQPFRNLNTSIPLSPDNHHNQQSWNLFNHVDKIDLRSYIGYKCLLPQLSSLRSLSLSLASLYLSTELLIHAIKSLPHITSIKIDDKCYELSDEHIELMVSQWPKLSRIEVVHSHITVDSLTALMTLRPQLTGIFLIDCNSIHALNLVSMVKYHASMLMELKLVDMKVAESDMIQMVSSCHHLQTIDLFYYLPSDAIISAITQHCIQVKILKLRYYHSNIITDQGIDLLTRSCHHIRVLDLETSLCLTAASIDRLAEAYADCLEEVTIRLESTLTVDINAFNSCRKKVRVEIHTG